MKTTLQDLHNMLVRIEERQIAVVDKVSGIIQSQSEHQKNDNIEFNKVYGKLDKLNLLAASIGVIAPILTVIIMKLF